MQDKPKTPQERLEEALWRLFYRKERPKPWAEGGNLPWDDPIFSRRMLREHLDESHGAASRVSAEREMQVEWMWEKLDLRPGDRVLDATCGPGLYAAGLADRGCSVTGIDFGPASIAHARKLAKQRGVEDRCSFVEGDVRRVDFAGVGFDAALFIYGQLAVFTPDEAQDLLDRIAAALRPGGRLIVELLDQDKVDKTDSTWWFTGHRGLWGEAPFLHLGERFWYPRQELSLERFQILHLQTGELDEIQLCDQTYSVVTMTGMMNSAGFSRVEVYPSWDGLSLYDAHVWNVYLANR